MNIISFDCIGIISYHLDIEDLNSLQRSCRRWWLALKTRKLGYVWQGKSQQFYHRNWTKILQKKKKKETNSEKLLHTISIFKPFIVEIPC